MKPAEKLLAAAVFIVIAGALLVNRASRHEPELTAAQKRTLEQRARDLAMVGQLEYGVLEPNVLVPVIDYKVSDAENMAEASCAHVNGHALYYRISINSKMAARCFDDAMRYTMPHEVGHLLVCQFSSKWDRHDDVWSNAVRFLGADPQEFHQCME